MIIAVSVSSGYRHELRSSLSKISGDVLLSAPDLNIMSDSRPIDLTDPAFPYVGLSETVAETVPVVWRAGIVKQGNGMHGVVVKGIPTTANDTIPLGVSIPRKLAMASGLEHGDRMLTYFIGDDMKVRQFNVVDVHDALVETDDKYVVYASLSDMQRLNGWSADQVSAVEVHLQENIDDEEKMEYASAMKEYYAEKYMASRKELRLNRIIALLLLIAGVLVLTFAFHIEHHIWSEVIDIAAWVLLWEAVDIWAFKNRELVLLSKRYLAFMNMKLEYLNMEKK